MEKCSFVHSSKFFFLSAGRFGMETKVLAAASLANYWQHYRGAINQHRWAGRGINLKRGRLAAGGGRKLTMPGQQRVINKFLQLILSAPGALPIATLRYY